MSVTDPNSELKQQDRYLRDSEKTHYIVIDQIKTAPPADVKGNDYVVAAGATGAWATHDTDIAFGTGNGWEFKSPNKGWTINDQNNDGDAYNFDGSLWVTMSGATVFPTVGKIEATQFDNPNTSDYAVNGLAPADPDSANSAITVRKMLDAGEKGIAFKLAIPTGVTSIKFDFKAKAESNGGGDVQLNFYEREMADNTAITAWSSAIQFTLITMPANLLYQEDTQTITLATLGLTAGSEHQIQITRDGDDGDDDLVDGYWLEHILPSYE